MKWMVILLEKLKMSKIGFFLLLMMLACYLSALYFFLAENRTFLLIAFILHGCLTIAFFFINQADFTKILLDSKQYTAQTEMEKQLLEQHERTIAQLKKENEALTDEKSALESQNTELQTENNNLVRSLSEASLREKSDICIAADSILPQHESISELNLIAVAQKVVDELSPASLAAGIKLSISSAGDTLLFKADEKYIRILFQNIIDNSIKYMKQNGSLVITLSNVGGNIFIALKDNGEGLNSTETEQIFALNYQGSNHTTGSGLGLYQVKAIVEHYGGTVYAKSENGMGIYIELPCSAN